MGKPWHCNAFGPQDLVGSFSHESSWTTSSEAHYQAKRNSVGARQRQADIACFLFNGIWWDLT